MWCEVQNSSSTAQFHCGSESFQNPVHHLHHHHHHGHHDYPHYSQNHEQCFNQDNSAFQVYGSDHTVMDYSGQACAGSCHPCWPAVVPDREAFCQHLDSSPCNSSSPNLPIDAQQNKIYSAITQECEHLLAQGECDKCTVRDDHGEEQSIPISDLVEIVLKTAESIKEEGSLPGDTVVLSKKRQQNKLAAAKYRDRQKNKWKLMQDERESLEKRNSALKVSVIQLQKEVDDMRKKLLGQR